MCKPSIMPDGSAGKRCLRHASGSKQQIQFTWAKTGVDKENIYAILKQLNKEGRKLDAPELAEVKEFLNKEEFKVKLDPYLSDRDRKMILKNLDKAREEAEAQGVTGGAFHAWKNVFKETVAKMKKPLVAMGLAGVLLAGLSGCSGSLDTPDKTNVPEPTGTVACSTENPGEYGDVVALEEVTDEYGTYCRTTIDPASTALIFDADKADSSLATYGFTNEDASAAQKTAVTLFSEQVLDSTRLDNYSTSAKEWLAENDSFILPKWRESFVNAVDTAPNGTGLSTTGMLVTDIMPTPLARNGGPRAQGTNISVTKVFATDNNQLAVQIESSSIYSATDTSIVKSVIKNNASLDEISIKASNPELFDGLDDSVLTLNTNTLIAFEAGNTNQISGVSSVMNLVTSNGQIVSKSVY